MTSLIVESATQISAETPTKKEHEMTDQFFPEPIEQKQFDLRVKVNSPLHKMLEASDGNSEFYTDDEVAEITGKKNTHWLTRMLSRNVDNLVIETKNGVNGLPMNVTYEPNVSIQAMVHATNIVAAPVQATGTAPASAEVGEMQFVFQSPASVPAKMDEFIKPNFYERMSAMVSAGRHVALYGPPSTGKDTAVQQLANQEGKRLVTIGGDVGFRKRDLAGSVQISNGVSYFEVAQGARAMIEGDWLLISEVNGADPDALMFLNAALAAPYTVTLAGKTFPVNPNFRLFVTYNLGLIRTKPLPPAFIDRFHSIKVDALTQHQIKTRLQSHLGDTSIPEYQIDWIVGFTQHLVEMQEDGNIRFYATLRRLLDVAKLMEAGYDAKKAVEWGMLDSINSPVERKTAELAFRNESSEWVEFADQFDMNPNSDERPF